MGLLTLQGINGLTIGALYGLSALGFTMIYKALGYLNFAHSDTIMLGALVYFYLVVMAGIPYPLAFILSLLIISLYGLATEKILFLRFRNASPVTFMLGILQGFFSLTKFGLSIRIACEDAQTASLMGVNTLTTRAATFMISAGLGATYISSNYKDVIVYLAGIIVLGFFPQGIFQRRVVKH